MAESDPLFDVEGRVFLCAGAASLLGSAVARALVERGARVALADLHASAADELAALFPKESVIDAFGLDNCDEEGVEAAVRHVHAAGGRLDGLLNAAGVYRTAPMEELALADLRASMEANFTGAFVLTRAAAGVMGEGGSILHLSSVSAQVSNPGYAAYASSKAALSHMVRVTARELAPRHIRVNAIGPAMTESPLVRSRLEEDAFLAQAVSHIPMGRLGVPGDIVAPALLLLSPGGAFITGQTIYADGGRTLV
ncbi:SDR family NAD(P)-dependent oxidoreductase [Afifella sp. IM 167]|uniref:SDR family NAD(P)-dependent oxidoreductase n=1 Tax=Afifella sp. IM 167 TaxID=2033586 RepID=UPI001CCEA03E|nr:SDR family oxidoreductase [Afifella sp. IM 167]